MQYLVLKICFIRVKSEIFCSVLSGILFLFALFKFQWTSKVETYDEMINFSNLACLTILFTGMFIYIVRMYIWYMIDLWIFNVGVFGNTLLHLLGSTKNTTVFVLLFITWNVTVFLYISLYSLLDTEPFSL